MAFLFKSKKDKAGQANATNASSAPAAAVQPAPSRNRVMTPTQDPQESQMRVSLEHHTPQTVEQKNSLDRIGRPSNLSGTTLSSGVNMNMNSSSVLYPWSKHDLTLTEPGRSPFPRYGHAANAVASKEGDIYLFGGLVESDAIKGDLWMIEAGSGSFHCYPLPHDTEGPAPGPRVGHASLFIGNAYILFGGDTKLQPTDTFLDNELYLLNVSTRQWTRADPDRTPSMSRKPRGRYGHTLNIIGSTLYVFGGQVEHTFFNDLVAFDLNSLGRPTWQFLIPNSREGGPAEGDIPAARTNHSMIAYDNKLYLFGGTNGREWFDDVWSYEPSLNKWIREQCGGYIPKAREGHSAALVGDTMYIYGGRKCPDPQHPDPENEDLDLADLSSFRIPTRRWYTFQNMGPEPTPRSGHTMSAFGKQIIVLGGEPSRTPTSTDELGMAYILDTAKIRYPPEGDRDKRQRAASSTERGPSGRNGSRGYGPREALPSREGPASVVIPARQPAPGRDMALGTGTKSPEPAPAMGSGPVSRTARGPITQHSSGPPPQQQAPTPQTNGMGPPPGRMMSPVGQYSIPGALPDSRPGTASNREMSGPSQLPEQASRGPGMMGSQAPPTYGGPGPNSRPGQDPRMNMAPQRAVPPPNQASAPFNDSPPDSPPSSMEKLVNGHVGADGSTFGNSVPPAPFQPVQRAPYGPDPQIAQLNQRLEAMNRKLEAEQRQKIWFQTELAQAEKSGYNPRRGSLAPQLESQMGKLPDEDQPMIEALFSMREELQKVQGLLSEQKSQAKLGIAEAQRQRDAAVSEAIYAKAKLAAHGGSVTSSPAPESSRGDLREEERYQEAQRRLAKTLGVQNTLNARIHALETQLEQEKLARQSVESNFQTMTRRAEESESSRHRSGSESTGLRSELLHHQKTVREETMRANQAVAELEGLKLAHRELASRHDRINSQHSQATSAIQALREAVQASVSKSSSLEEKLDEQRESKEEVESKLRKLQAQHEDQAGELETALQRLRDAEAVAKSHAEEARTHRTALMAGLDKVGSRDLDDDARSLDAHSSERLAMLQSQIESANALAKRNQGAADNASDKLRMAEERIAGLEAFQEQSNREEQKLRKQLRTAIQETQATRARLAELEENLNSHKLESSAVSVQHNALKSLLAERGINPNDPKSGGDRGSPSSGFGISPPDQIRLQELEERLEASAQEQREMETMFSRREAEQDQAYNKKLDALQDNHQKAMKYIKDTEKVIEKMKKEAGKLKVQNETLRREAGSPNSKSVSPEGREQSAAWDKERTALKREIEQLSENVRLKTTRLEEQLSETNEELSAMRAERDEIKSQEFAQRREAEQRHGMLAQQLDHLKQENDGLESRALEAENRAKMLLSQMENSVDNYRRQSRMPGHLTGGGSKALERSDSKEGPTSHAAGSHAAGETSGRNRSHSNMSALTDSTSAETSTPLGGLSARESYMTDPHGRSSLALDNLASELDALRSHWEMTSKASHDSRTSVHLGGGTTGEGLASWRRNLGGEEDEEETDAEDLGSPVDTRGGKLHGYDAEVTPKLGVH